MISILTSYSRNLSERAEQQTSETDPLDGQMLWVLWRHIRRAERRRRLMSASARGEEEHPSDNSTDDDEDDESDNEGGFARSHNSQLINYYYNW